MPRAAATLDPYYASFVHRKRLTIEQRIKRRSRPPEKFDVDLVRNSTLTTNLCADAPGERAHTRQVFKPKGVSLMHHKRLTMRQNRTPI